MKNAIKRIVTMGMLSMVLMGHGFAPSNCRSEGQAHVLAHRAAVIDVYRQQAEAGYRPGGINVVEVSYEGGECTVCAEINN